MRRDLRVSFFGLIRNDPQDDSIRKRLANDWLRVNVDGRDVHGIVSEAEHDEIVRADVIDLVRGIASTQSLPTITHAKTCAVLA